MNQPRCQEHNFPMIEIGGSLECPFEFLNRCIGQEPIVDVIKRKGTVFYIFGNGHKLPMLCSCCDHPLVYENLKQARLELLGRRLDNMFVGERTLDDGQKIEQLLLGLSEVGDLPPVDMPVSFSVAARMRHPANCPHSAGPTTANKTAPSKKRRRSRAVPGRN